MSNHIDQLAEWWENAEEGVVQEGDTVIEYLNDGHHAVYVADMDQDQFYGFYRILARAPKPKPAWHDAVAVIATGDVGDGDWITGVWVPDGTPDYWESTETGIILRCGDLSDVTPLIEAKVTDEMVDRIRECKDFTGRRYFASREGARHLLAIALGLETE